MFRGDGFIPCSEPPPLTIAGGNSPRPTATIPMDDERTACHCRDVPTAHIVGARGGHIGPNPYPDWERLEQHPCILPSRVGDLFTQTLVLVTER